MNIQILLAFIAVALTGTTFPAAAASSLRDNFASYLKHNPASSIVGLVEADLSAGAVLGAVEATHVFFEEPQDNPETVLSTFRIKDGKEEDFVRTERQTWATYTQHDLVKPNFHVLLRGSDESGKVVYTELFTWKSHAIPDHASADVKTLWAQLESECEARGGHRGIEFSEVQIVVN